MMTREEAPSYGTKTAIAADESDHELVDRLRLLYQPVIAFADWRVGGIEVLSRLIGTDQRLQGPEKFVAAMSSAAVSARLTMEILRRSLAEQKVLRLLDATQAPFGYNLPLDAMLHPQLTDLIGAVRGPAPARHIVFELTEQHPVTDIGALRDAMGRLIEVGYSVVLDDITPDTPNLTALMELPFSALKLDRSVVVSEAPGMAGYVSRVVAAARPTGCTVIAEGIETEEALQRMRDLGVSHGQGFLFARPMPAAALPGFLRGWRQGEPP